MRTIQHCDRALGTNNTDDDNRASATSFFVHHTQRLSKSAACGDIDGIHDSVRGLKQRMAAGSAARAA